MIAPTITEFQVFPRLPERLAPLRELAYNLRWSWDHETIALFRRMDSDLWEEVMHNPVLMLGRISQERVAELASDDSFLSHMDRALAGLRGYLGAKRWYSKTYDGGETPFIAYFSMEFGLTECIANYSGGLGILSGDHLKSASDMGIPLVGVGLLYQQGYFRQYLNVDGWQQERYPDNDFYNLPMTLERRDDGTPVTIRVPMAGREVHAQIWRIQVGRTPLYLLDANVAQNSPDDRAVTQTLYGGDAEMRIRQEILLGIGGIRALVAMGIRPSVCHMNEGHAAFLALERIRMVIAETGCSFQEALVATRAGNVFTTHTPVPAGFDLFDQKLMEKYLGSYLPELRISIEELMRLGRAEGAKEGEPFNMAICALHTSLFRNAVSRLHGKVARRMWKYDWPQVPEEEVPIGHITNGVHLDSFVSREMADLLERYLGSDWQMEIANEDLWKRIDEIPDEELWRTHERRRERLIAFARKCLVRQYQQRGMANEAIQQAGECLLPTALTLGFARRFATYKRATLLLRDKERLRRLLTNDQCPVQIIFAGKAHPHDMGGKKLIREIVHFAQEPDVRNRVVFIEDYDITVARALVQGVDVWLNTPRRPLEASGTSGMKVVINGGLNLSVLDGWWDEGYSREVGWAIGHGEEYRDEETQDTVESEELFNILEREVVPMFYQRGRDHLPRAWIAKMKASMKKLCPFFNTDRMVREYTQKYYEPARAHYHALSEHNLARARELTAWSDRVRAEWHKVHIERVEARTPEKVYVRQNVPVQAWVHLGGLTPEDVTVEAYLGPMNAAREIVQGQAIPLVLQKRVRDNVYLYEGQLSCTNSGRYGFAVRVLPQHPDLVDRYLLRLIHWK
ncbi:MAG: alpha-glucan family phosphorylase [bacterium]|nr:alpha-glucan family phosphorylase [bacterium]